MAAVLSTRLIAPKNPPAPRGGFLDGAEAPGIDRPTGFAVNEMLIGDYRSAALAFEIIGFYSLWQPGDVARATHLLRLVFQPETAADAVVDRGEQLSLTLWTCWLQS